MKKGFTLIELLVVIAIIGILASIVLVSFPGATKKAKDTRVVSAIAQARTVMSYVYANDGSYAAFTPTHVDMVTLWTEITNNDREGSDAQAPAIVSGVSAACIYAKLSAKDGYYYCADSTGVAGNTSTNPNTTCVGTSYTCPAVTG